MRDAALIITIIGMAAFACLGLAVAETPRDAALALAAALALGIVHLALTRKK